MYSAHRLLAGGWFPAGVLTLGASYFARFESYPAALYAPFTGTLQRAETTAALRVGRGGRIGLSYHLARDGVERDELSWIQHGPAAELRLQVARRVRVGVSAALGLRDYDAVDASLGVMRSDAYLDAAGLLELDLADRFTLRLSLEGRKAFSNAPAFDYTRFVPVVGVAYVVGM